jgi:hypothetical protein
VFPSDEKAGFLGALVNGPGVEPGTRVAVRIETGNTFQLVRALDSSHVTLGGTYTFSFYGPVTGAGQVDAASPNVISGLDPDVVAQLNVIGPGLLVDGPGITNGTKLRKVNIQNDPVELDQNAAASPAPVRFTFS